MTIDELRARKKETGLTYEMISECSGIPVATLQKIFQGKTKTPRYRTLLALSKALDPEAAEPGKNTLSGKSVYRIAPKIAGVREQTFVYGTSAATTTDDEDDLQVAGNDSRGMPRYIIDTEGNYIWTMQGSYTVEDYLALPDEKRVELIDGVIYDMGAPRYLHQKIAGEVYRQIANYILDRGGSCEVFIAPADVQLDNDNYTMVQPDVFILCDHSKSDALRMYGAPDFVLEVISPYTKKKDFTIKLHKYMNAGVREYWIMDPYREVVLVYFFENDDVPQIYNYNEPVPVRIYDGKLSIDPKHIARWILEEKEGR